MTELEQHHARLKAEYEALNAELAELQAHLGGREAKRLAEAAAAEEDAVGVLLETLAMHDRDLARSGA